MASTILGGGAVHHCVELSGPLVARCRRSFAACSDPERERGFGYVPELRHARVHCCSIFDVDLDGSLKYDRIYVGAGARAKDARVLGKLLKPGVRGLVSLLWCPFLL